MRHMRRREFITFLGGAAVAWPLAALAQQGARMRRVGLLLSYAESDPEGQARIAALQKGLTQLGWMEGSNIRLDYCRVTGDMSRMSVCAAELVKLAPDLILANSNPGMQALKQETSSVPVLFVAITDPVGGGFVASLTR